VSVIDATRTAGQRATPRLATKVALAAALASAFGAVYESDFVSPGLLALLIGIVGVARVAGHPRLLGERVQPLPINTIAIVTVAAALYLVATVGVLVATGLFCVALFLLCLDWSAVSKLQLPLLLSFLLDTASVLRGRIEDLAPVLAVWAAAAVAA
jgi:hypothetical protein